MCGTGWDLSSRRENKEDGTREETVECEVSALGGEKKNQTHWKVRGKEGKNPQKVGDRLSLESRGKPKQRHRAGRPVKNQRGSSTVIDTTKEKEDADKQGGTA